MNKPMHIVGVLPHITYYLTKSVSMQMYPVLTGPGAEAHSQRTKSPESDDTIDTHTLRTDHSSLTAWTNTNTRGASMDTSTLADDDDRTLSVYQPHSVRKSAVVSKTMLVVEPHDPEPGFRKAVGLWFDSFLNSFKSCLSGY